MNSKKPSHLFNQALKWLSTLLIIAIFLLFFFGKTSTGAVYAQFPTVTIPTVTGSPQGPYVVVTLPDGEKANIRSGPNTTYTRIGVMEPGQTAPALGRYGNFIKISYPGPHGETGWIYIPNISLIGEVPEVLPPPTETPSITRTIDPTMAAQFIGTPAATNLPTFTPPPPLLIPTFQDAPANAAPGGIPVGLVIVVLFGLGLFLALIAILRRG